ncbi:co-chaperone YbbN, partial [Schumannella luteola]
MTDLPTANLRGAVDLSGLVRRAAEPPRGDRPAGEAGASAIVFDTSDAEFQGVLELSARVPVVVEFVAPGLAPALPPVVESYGGRLVLAIVDGTVNPQLAQAFQVREVPT